MAEVSGVIGAGTWVVDRVKRIDRWPGEGNLCNVLSVEAACGGGPANVLFDLAAMTREIPLYAVGSLGDDEDGAFLLAETSQRGIDTAFLHRRAGLSTGFSDVMSGAGKRTFFCCRGANSTLAEADFEGLDFPAKIFYLGYLLLLDALDADDPEYGTKGARLLHSMRSRGYLTVVDFVSEAPAKFRRVVGCALPHIDVLVVNEIEAGCAFGIEVRRPDGTFDRAALRRAALAFLENGVRRAAVIHYPEGALAVFRDAGEFWNDSFPVREIVGSNGAGDAFCAGVLYALHEDLPPGEMLKLGAASAAFNLRSASASGGAVPLETLQNFIRENAR